VCSSDLKNVNREDPFCRESPYGSLCGVLCSFVPWR